MFREESIFISDSIGSVSALVHAPADMKFMMVLGHGAGANMRHVFMEKLAIELGKVSIGSIRYNFAYMEQKRKMPDPAPVAEKTVGVVIQYAIKEFPVVPLLAGGKSFGGRMSSQYLSKSKDTRVKGIVFYGFPLHPAGKPSIDRTKHFSDIAVPMLFLQGTKDTLAEIDLIKQVTSKISLSRLKLFENADHSFKVAKQDLIPSLAECTLEWASGL